MRETNNNSTPPHAHRLYAQSDQTQPHNSILQSDAHRTRVSDRFLAIYDWLITEAKYALVYMTLTYMVLHISG
jgi:hypothetical protein